MVGASGIWPLAPHLEADFYIPFVEPEPLAASLGRLDLDLTLALSMMRTAPQIRRTMRLPRRTLVPLSPSPAGLTSSRFVVESEASAMLRRGFEPGPVIDLTRSAQFDVTSWRLVEWVCHLLQSGAPPLTTFSPAAHPAVRSYDQPLGFDRKERRRLLGNATAFACFIIFIVAVRVGAPALLEQPRLSKMRWLAVWQWLKGLRGVSENWLASCAYGAPYQKQFALLGHRLDLASIHRKCPPGNHQHIRIEGQLTKQSAIYHLEVASALARVICRALLDSPSAPLPPKPGLQSFADPWSNLSAWCWGQRINVLEGLAALETIKYVISQGGSRKVHLLLDSAVVCGVIGKGRSSSRLLRPILCKIGASLAAGGVYLGMHHAPTRLNTADAPTGIGTCLPLRPFLCWICSLPPICGLSEASSGWIRLALLSSLKYSWDRGLFGFASLLSTFSTARVRTLMPRWPRLATQERGLSSETRKMRFARSNTGLPEGRPVLPRTVANRTK